MKFRVKRKRTGAAQVRRSQSKKKAPAGPAKREARKLPERRTMIAAVRRGNGKGPGKLPAALAGWSRRADRAANRALERAHPPLRRAGRRSRALAVGAAAWAGPRLRPPAAAFFRGLALAEALLRRAAALAARGATAASEVITPRRAIGAVIVAAGACLIASQFVDYHGVEIGQSGYANLPDVAKPPTVDVKTAGQAHSYVLAPLGLAAILLGALGIRRERRALGLGTIAIGLASLAVILLVDLSSGLDAGAQTSRFAGASAVLDDGFYGELAAAAALVLAGLLYYARPCRIRISSSGRAASARRRRPRPPDSSPARVARSA
jgi:hypothetical protein